MLNVIRKCASFRLHVDSLFDTILDYYFISDRPGCVAGDFNDLNNDKLCERGSCSAHITHSIVALIYKISK